MINAAERKNADLVLMDGGEGRRLYSARALRKPTPCQSCKRIILVGQRGYGEVTSSTLNRKWRFCDPCVNAATRK